MRKIISFALLVLLLTVCFVLYNLNSARHQVAREQRAVLLLNGSAADQSWNESHYLGLRHAAASLNVKLEVRENVPETEASLAAVEEAIQGGARYVFASSFGYGPWLKQAAIAHPEIYFFHCTGTETRRNLTTYFGRIYQLRYLSGIAAGLETKTGEIGYVAAFPLAEVIRGINAFTLGVRQVNPTARVHVRWSHSWLDDDSNGDATTVLLNKYPIDVLTLHANSLQPLLLAERHGGIKTIGYNMDNRSMLPHSFLTAVTWRWERFYSRFLSAAIQGSLSPDYYWDDLQEYSMELAPLPDKTPRQTVLRVEQERQHLLQHRREVFCGPIYDNKGRLRVPAGELMSDLELLKDLDWFVEGVADDE